MQANLAKYLLRLIRESGVKKRIIPGIPVPNLIRDRDDPGPGIQGIRAIFRMPDHPGPA